MEFTGTTIELEVYATLGLSVLVLLFGRWLVKNIPILAHFCIPAPVAGGLIFSLLNLLGHMTGTFRISIDTTLQSIFMIMFFTTVGFSANLAILKKGGLGVVIFLALASGLCVIQNAAGVGIASLFGQNPLLGIATGSVPLTGGHGTAAAFGPLLEASGLNAGATVAVAAATFGLVAGSLLGGPTATLIYKTRRHSIESKREKVEKVETDVLTETRKPLISGELSIGFFQIGIAVGIGFYVSKAIAMTGLTVPAYIGSMLVAAVMCNVFKPGSGKATATRSEEITALGDMFLAIFLSQALMGLKLWELADLALPMIVILLVQVLIMFLFAYFITFNVMGRDHDAAVLAAGHCGFGMGATPTAIANMNAVSSRFGPAPRAFFIIPIVGGLFIDFTNALIITAFINFVK